MKFHKLILVVICIAVLSGCSKTTYLDETEPYSALIGKRYKLVTDCFLVQHPKKKHQSKYPQIMCNVNIPGIGYSFLPMEVSGSDIGKIYGIFKIINILPKGSTFTLTSVREERTVEMRLLYFEILFHEEELQYIELVDAISVLDDSSEPHNFHEAVAVEIKDEN